MPLLTAANWGGQGLHTRGNFDGFTRAASAHKWLEVHGLEHWTHFYTDYGVGLQKRFFACFLHGDDAGWRDQPAVQLQVRALDGFMQRAEREWPLAPGSAASSSLLSGHKYSRVQRVRASGHSRSAR